MPNFGIIFNIMESFIAFFETMPTWHKLVWIIFMLLLTWGLEAVTPLFRMSYNKWRHARTNLLLLVGVILVNLVFGLLTLAAVHQVSEYQIGLFYIGTWSLLAQFVITFLVLDLVSQYMAHYLLHKVKWMWKLHMVHHSDTRVDATTGTRLHPGDFLLRECLSLIVILILGAPLAFYLFYRFLTIFFTYITHANIALPLWMDKGLSIVFITPNMHKFHHHFERPWTDTNFGNIFSVWDRLFGTFVYDDPDKIIYGLDVLDSRTEDDISFQLNIPFNKDIKTDY
ncbi:MAG: sterol desaturase family protein [Saprospiraceae bacterium]|nr:sterol desaturase family protein [Saprospiraceae bacterium]